MKEINFYFRSISFLSLDLEHQKENDPDQQKESTAKQILKLLTKMLLVLGYNAYIGYAVYHHKSQATIVN